MHTAAMRVELRIRDAGSLKEKRHVVKALRSRLLTTFGVAVAEVDHQDKWQRATLGIAAVAASPGHVDRILHTVRAAIDEDARVEILEYAVSHLEGPE